MTQRSVLDALEGRYPMLHGTIRGHDGGPRRAFIRFFACELDLSQDPPDDPLPDAVAAGPSPISSSAPWREDRGDDNQLDLKVPSEPDRAFY